MLFNLSHNELVNLFTVLNENITNPVFIANQDFIITYSNEAFESFVQKSQNDILNKPFGNVLGCMYIEKDGKDCGGNYYCKLCGIRDAMKECLSGENKIKPNQTVRDFLLGEEIIFRYIGYTAIRISAGEHPHVLVIITDSRTDTNSLPSE
jgi:hypothetical protein